MVGPGRSDGLEANHQWLKTLAWFLGVFAPGKKLKKKKFKSTFTSKRPEILIL